MRILAGQARHDAAENTFDADQDGPGAVSATSPLGAAESDNPLVAGLERLPVHPTSLVIFGATGDLAHRKLLPALYNLAHEGQLPERFEVIGVGRRDPRG